MELRYLEGTVNEIQSRISMVNGAITEMRLSALTLEGLEQEKEGSQLFVPIGGGSYVKAKLETSETVVVGIGADVAVEKTLKETREEIEVRVSEMEKTRDVLGQQLNQVLERIQDNRAKLDEITATLREEEKSSGVREAKERA
ncbi:MAG: prefoldin subunit alpha [Candidatus Bathyarchaeia archaeon]|jgi:prefoldin alpha subunit